MVTKTKQATRKGVVCLDLDGVLADFTQGWQGPDKIGDPIKGAVQFTHDLGKIADVVIHTCRCTEDIGKQKGFMLEKPVRRWLEKHGFHFDHIHIGQGKPVAHAYIDDRGVSCRPQDLGNEFPSALAQAKRLISGDVA